MHKITFVTLTGVTMGRPENPQRCEFSFKTVEGKVYPRATCLHCGLEMVDNSTRLGDHLNVCEKFQQKVTSAGQSGNSRKRLCTMDEFCDTISPMQKSKSDEKLAEMIFALGLPFRIVEWPPFVEFVRSLKPAYSLPSRKAIAGEMLESHYARLQEKVEAEMDRARSICLTVDAWTNVRNESVVGFTATTPKPCFLKAVFPGDAPHTADFYFGETSAMIQSVGRSKVTAIVTDNAVSMRAMWKRVESEFPGIICLGCAAHSLNLLLLDVFKLDSPKQLLEMCKRITSLFAYSSQCDAILKACRDTHDIKLDWLSR